MMVDQMDMLHRIMLMNDDHLMYAMVFVHKEFLFVHRFLMSKKNKSMDEIDKRVGVFFFLPQIPMYCPINIENEQ